MNMDNRFYTAGLYAGEDMPALLAVWPYRTGGKALCFVRPEQEAELLALLNAEPELDPERIHMMAGEQSVPRHSLLGAAFTPAPDFALSAEPETKSQCLRRVAAENGITISDDGVASFAPRCEGCGGAIISSRLCSCGTTPHPDYGQLPPPPAEIELPPFTEDLKAEAEAEPQPIW